MGDAPIPLLTKGLRPFGTGTGSHNPNYSVSPSVSDGFMTPHFRFLVVLFVVSLLVVVMCEVISTIGKASSIPKLP